ncbi:glycosyltransferase family 4 protein [Lunatibacter salilacus]|uniref:glycosyltransferase family 4 protein n=1 Tax=Lunatibacter salilacus TaxID=2483804 RepID=UPI00131CFC24|nr:glycosyltransferase family 4 protein [Lunatibacter salilacus]
MSIPKRVLIITYYWPPSAGSGVQRWLKFAKYLPEFGWDPVIFTPENPDFDLKDPLMEKEVSPHMEVLKFPIWEPYQVLRLLKTEKISDPGILIEKKRKNWFDKVAIWIRANAIIPDPRVYWVKPSVKFLGQLMESNNFQAVITTGPPHSMHLIGRELKRRHGIPWLADFRDPWSTWEFLDTLPMTGWVKNRHLALEASVFREADALVTISPTFQQEMEHLADRKIQLITNGFDPVDLPSDFLMNPPESQTLEIVYTGVIDAIRNPMPFLLAMKEVFGQTKNKIKLTFVGRVSQQVKTSLMEDSWLSSHVELAGYVPHEAVFQYYAKAHILLLILTNTKNAKGNIPGKVFEYMATGRKIVALGDPEGDTAQILRQAQAGEVFRHEDRKGLISFLENCHTQAVNSQQTPIHTSYERKTLTGQLADLLNKITVGQTADG